MSPERSGPPSANLASASSLSRRLLAKTTRSLQSPTVGVKLGLSPPVESAFSIHRSSSCLRLAAICAGSVTVAVLAASALASSSSLSALARFHLSISDLDTLGLDTNVPLGAGCARGCRECECDCAAEGSAVERKPSPSSLRAGAGPAAMTCLGGGGGGGGRAGRAGNARWSGCAAVSATLVLACVAALAALAYFGGIDDVVALTIAPIAQSQRGGAPSARARDAPRGAHPFAARMRRDFEQSRREVRDLHRKLDETTAREERLEGSLSPWALTASLSPDPPRYLRDEDEATWKAREKAKADAKAEAKKAEKAAKRDEDARVAEKKDEPPARSSRASRKAPAAPRRAGGGKASSSRA
mmetsp:Transcript_4425/g.18311  ORF Transcript_4425/g.18311 Transcript_4425/m.18311 type:complete len:357 (-) Transcript_4425:37-1107(-)